MKAEIADPRARIVLAKGDSKSCFSTGSICHGAEPVPETFGFGSAMHRPGFALSSGKYLPANSPNQPDHKSGDKKPKNKGDAVMLLIVFCAPKPNAESGHNNG